MIMKKETYNAVMKQTKKDIARAKKKANKEAEQFQKERKKQMKLAFKIINPSISYDKEYDILYLWFGGKNKVASTIELSDDTRIDISKKGIILAIEICNFQDKIKGEKL